jgi:energy-coupling factor transporter transmembrane protein EcfT
MWPPVFVILCILLFIVGGGFAQVLVIIIAWIVSTQIHSPLSWWEKKIPHPIRNVFARLWLPILILGVLFFTVGFGIWLFVLPPGEIREVTTTHYLVWTALFIGIFLLSIDIMFGFSRDIELRS